VLRVLVLDPAGERSRSLVGRRGRSATVGDRLSEVATYCSCRRWRLDVECDHPGPHPHDAENIDDTNRRPQ